METQWPIQRLKDSETLTMPVNIKKDLPFNNKMHHRKMRMSNMKDIQKWVSQLKEMSTFLMMKNHQRCLHLTIKTMLTCNNSNYSNKKTDKAKGQLATNTLSNHLLEDLLEPNSTKIWAIFCTFRAEETIRFI